MTDIAMLGIRIDSTPATKAAKDLDVLAVSAGRADVATGKVGMAAGKMAPKMSAGAQQSRMMAMQLSQVAQQASATGNWVQALAIQLPDMALGFGTAGIAAGILAGVALPALVGMLGASGNSAAEVANVLGGLAEKTQAAADAASAAKTPTAELAATYGALAGAAREALQAIADVALVDAITAADDAISAVSDSLTRVATFSGTRVLRDDFDMTSDAARTLVVRLLDLERADGLVAQAAAAARVRDALIATYGTVEKMPAPLQAAYSSLAKITLEAAKTNTITSQLPAILAAAQAAANAAAGAVAGIGDAAASAYGSVSTLVGKMWEMAEARAAYSDGVGGGRGMGTGGPALDPYGFRAQLERDSKFKPPSSTDAPGAGGGASDPYATDLQALIENLQSARAVEDEWYQENLAILEDRRSVEIMGKQAHDAAMVSLHEEYQRRIADIDMAAQQQRISDTANLFGALASVAQAGGQKMAKAAAVAQAIEGTVNAYGAALKALNTPGLTLAGRFAAYASVLAAGLKGVSAIRAAGGVGGGGGGSVAAQGATGGGQTIEYKVYGLERDAVYSGAFIEKIFSGLMEEGKRRGKDNQSVVFL